MPRKKTNPAEETDQFQADELAEQAEACLLYTSDAADEL